MIISRAPVRISLGGGGTDLKSYYSKFGGFLVAGAINKYVYIAVNKRFDDSIRLSYSATEIVRNAESIKHRIFKEAFKLLNMKWGVEVVSIADVPANSGLGSSSVFTVSLLNALHCYKKEYVSLQQLAEEACQIEIDILGDPIGKQDQYMGAFGSLTALTFEKNGDVRVEALKIPARAVQELESKALLFYTKIERSASEILGEQNESIKKDEERTLEALHEIKKIGIESKKALEDGQLDKFGELLAKHWQVKKRLSGKITDPFLDHCYEEAMKHGSTGGKIMGAGGGGFFMFYCPKDQEVLIRAMKRMGLVWMPFRFEPEGAKVVVNFPQ